MRFFHRRILTRVLVCCILALVPFPELENQIYDLKIRARGSSPLSKANDAVIIEMTKEDFDELKRTLDLGASERSQKNRGTWFEKFESLRDQFFWNDAVYISLFQKILQESPRYLLVSYFYSDSLVNLSEQPELQRIARGGKIIWGSYFDLDQKFIKPATDITGNENYGFINLHPDTDGVIRRAFLVYQNHSSMAFRALLEGPLALTWKMSLTEPFLINYVGKVGAIPTCRVIDVLVPARSDVCGSLKDKYVILTPVGNSIAGTNSFRTPVGMLSRAEILANILLTAKHNQAFIPVSNYFLLVAIFVHVSILGFAILNRSAIYQILLVFNLIFSEALIATLSLSFLKLQIPLLPFVFASIACYIVFLWLKFSQQEQIRWQALNRSQQLKELDEYKSNFISLMSHDLKTPIAKVQALTERLHREAVSLTSEHRLILTAIQKSNDELAKYILSILNFQKVETQELTLNRKSHDINALIEEVVERVEPLAQDKKISIQKDLEPMFSVELDETLIRQVLNNIIENALKYSQPQTVVTVSSVDQGDFVRVSVRDNGPGMSLDQVAKLFRKFSREEKGTAERIKGTGLGLYLSKYFIELHGGRIEVTSEEGVGSEFCFYLPVNTQ